MKGVQYLTDETGKKTHAVLDLSIWQDKGEVFVPAAKGVRKPGQLKAAFEQAGFHKVGDALLEPMTEAELKDWYDTPIFADEPSS